MRRKANTMFSGYGGSSGDEYTPKIVGDYENADGEDMHMYSEDALSPNQFVNLEFPSGETVQEYMDSLGTGPEVFEKVTQRMTQEGVLPIGQGKSANKYWDWSKVASSSSEIIEAIPVFCKRLPQAEVLVGENELTSVDEDSEEYENYIAIPDISSTFSEILGYSIEFTEDIQQDLISNLRVSEEFSEVLHAVFINIPGTAISKEIGGVHLTEAIERDKFDIREIEFEEDSIMVRVTLVN